mgnify:CR=1 FL=1
MVAGHLFYEWFIERIKSTALLFVLFFIFEKKFL